MTIRIVIFNGPPSSGKDTAALACFKSQTVGGFKVFDRMSRPIKKAFAGMVNAPINKFDVVENWEHRKDEPLKILDGKTFRNWQQDFGEKFMKPLYGENIFARLFIERQHNQAPNATIFVPDCGFDIEYETLALHYGTENILVVKLYRPGYTFAGDTRKYLDIGSRFASGIEDPDIENVRHINNSTTRTAFEMRVLEVVSDWLEGGHE